MAYKIHQFDALVLSDYQQDGDVQNMGTGEALTSFQQLPNGTYYDHYGSSKSPQGIRPIRKKCVLWGDTTAELREAMDDIRAKIGVRGKLTVQFGDGTLRWQWARLASVDMPEDVDASQVTLTCDMEWITAAQHWYEIINSPEEWTVGDGTWVMGDGTAELGENGTSVTLSATGATGTAPPAGGTTQTVNLTHYGNIAATNLIFTITAGSAAITAVKIANGTTGESFYFSASVAAGDVLVVDCGAMSVTNDAVNAYSSFVPGNRARWMTLASGANVLTVTVNGNAGVDGTFAIEYYDHFA